MLMDYGRSYNTGKSPRAVHESEERPAQTHLITAYGPSATDQRELRDSWRAGWPRRKPPPAPPIPRSPSRTRRPSSISAISSRENEQRERTIWLRSSRPTPPLPTPPRGEPPARVPGGALGLGQRVRLCPRAEAKCSNEESN